MRRLLLGICVVAACAAGGSTRARADAPALPSRLQVLDADGRPLPGARLVAIEGDLEDRAVFRDRAPVVATTEADGLIVDVPAVAGEARRLAVWYPERAAALVPPGPGPVTVRLLSARRTTGRLRLPARQKALGKEIVAVPLARHADLVHVVTTDAQGVYAFQLLHAGPWALFLRQGRHRLQRIGAVEAGADAGETRLIEETVLRGRILDADGTHRAAVPGVRLAFARLDPAPPTLVAPTSVQTGDDGSFVVRGLPAGVYRVELQDEHWVFEPRPPVVQAERGRERDIPAWFALRRRRVHGQVLDVDDKPVAGVRIRLLPDPTQALPPGAPPEGTKIVQSDVAGRFVLPDVAPGEGWRLLASAEGYSPWASRPFRVDRGRDTTLKPFHVRRGWRVEVKVETVDGDPIAGAVVTGTAARHPSAADDPVWRDTLREAHTDADGRAVLRDLPDDDVIVEAHAAGHGPAHIVVDLPRVSDVRKTELVLHPTLTLRGRLIQPPEKALAGPFEVLAVRREGAHRISVTATPEGNFAVPDLSETAYDIRVLRPEDGGPRLLATIEHVVPTAEMHLEIGLPTLLAVRGIVDYVFAADAQPAPHVLVETQQYDPRSEDTRWVAVAQAPIAAATQGGAGSFEVTGLAPGLYTVRAVHGALDSGTLTVVLDDEDADGLELALPAGARVAGTVLDPDGKPLLGAWVRLVRLHGPDDAPLTPVVCVADERGDFVVDGLAPGLWRIEAAEEERAGDVETVRLADGEVLVVRDLVLGEGAELEGSVQDVAGRPLDGVHVEVRRLDGEGSPQTLRTGADGRFALRHARPGTWSVRVEAITAAGGPWIEAIIELETGKTAQVPFVAGEDGAIEGTVLKNGQPVSGALIDLVHEPVSADAPLRRYRASTGPEGRFSVAHLSAGAYMLQIRSGAWRSAQAVELAPGDRLSLDLEAFAGRLRGRVVTREGVGVAGARVEAVPLDDADRAAGDAPFLAEGRTDPRGQFVLGGLPVGRYTVTVSAPGQPPGRYVGAEADLEGADFPVEIVLGRGGDVDLRVLDPDERGVTGALVWIEDADGLALHHSPYLTGAAGRLRIEGVPPGNLRVRVQARGFGAPALQPVRVEEGRTSEVRIRVQTAGSIELVVTGDAGDPLGRTRVDLRRAGSGELVASRRPLSPIRLGEPWGWVPRTGVLRLDDLESGTYVLQVTAGRTYQPAELRVQVEAGRTTRAAVTLVPAGR